MPPTLARSATSATVRPGQDRDVEPVRPGRGDRGEPAQRPAGTGLDRRGSRVA